MTGDVFGLLADTHGWELTISERVMLTEAARGYTRTEIIDAAARDAEGLTPARLARTLNGRPPAQTDPPVGPTTEPKKIPDRYAALARDGLNQARAVLAATSGRNPR